MSTQQGAGGHSGASPAEPAAKDTATNDTPPVDAQRPEPAGHDAEILAAGGTVLGESEIAGLADRSRIRRAPRYKRFAVLGGLVGVLIAAVATPFAEFETLSPWGLFLLLVVVLVPFMILVTCAVAMFTDKAARVPKRTRKQKGRR